MTHLRLSRRARDIVPFLAMEVMERGFAMQRDGLDVVHMGVGEPEYSPPPEAVAETARALRAGHTRYTDSRGLRDLREAIAADTLRRRGVQVHPDRILVTSGTSPAMYMVFALLLDPGDEIIVPTPHYACYPNIIGMAGGRPVYVPTRAEDGFRVDVDAVRAAITPRTRGIIVASPANPTGAVQPREVLEGLADLGVPLLSDEIYHGLEYEDAEAWSPLGRSESCFVFDGFSKRYAMTGFRLGYVIVPEAAARPLQSMAQNLFISTNHFVQHAGIAALASGTALLDEMRAEYDRRRRMLVEGVRRLGLGLPVAPRGAFYVFADASHIDQDSLSLAFRILDKAHVALGPGRDFGELGEGFLRFSFCASPERIAEGLARLERVLPTL